MTQRLGSICVTVYFQFAKNADSVPQTFVYGGTTEAKTFPQNTQLWWLCEQDYMEDMPVIPSSFQLYKWKILCTLSLSLSLSLVVCTLRQVHCLMTSISEYLNSTYMCKYGFWGEIWQNITSLCFVFVVVVSWDQLRYTYSTV